MILMLAALAIEARPVVSALEERYLATNPSLPAGDEVPPPAALVAFAGMGLRAGQVAEHMLAAYPQTLGVPIDGVISFGFGGGLAAELVAGDVVIVRQTRLVGGEQTVASDGGLVAQALAAARDAGVRAHEGTALTVTEPLTEPGDKRRLRGETGADVVEMEGYWLGEAARRAGVPFLALRAVFDTAADRLPYIPGSVRADGTIRPWKALAYVALRPWSLGWLRALAAARDTAAGSLARFFAAFMGGRGPITVAGAIGIWRGQ